MKRALSLFAAALVIFSLSISGSALEQSSPVWSSYGKRDNVYSQVSTEEKAIALTFDDGPHPKYTAQILDILKEYGVKATFFVIGKNAELCKDVVKRCAEEGHEIGNHTYTHATADACSYETLKEEIGKTERIITSLTGRTPYLFRPPTGLCNQNTVALSKELGFKTIVWNVDTRDWAHTRTERIISSVLGNVKSGSIILMHDYIDPPSYTPEALRVIIPELIARGYTFVTVSELLELDI